MRPAIEAPLLLRSSLMYLFCPDNEDWVTRQQRSNTLSRAALADSSRAMPAVIVMARAVPGAQRCSAPPLGGRRLDRSLAGHGLGPWRRQRVGCPRRRWEES